MGCEVLQKVNQCHGSQTATSDAGWPGALLMFQAAFGSRSYTQGPAEAHTHANMCARLAFPQTNRKLLSADGTRRLGVGTGSWSARRARLHGEYNDCHLSLER